MLPVLLLDTSDRPDVAEYIRIQKSFEPGDVTFQSGRVRDTTKEQSPSSSTFFGQSNHSTEFDIVKQGILVELALTGHGLYLTKANAPDDRLKKDFERPKIIVEIGDTGFQEVWDKKFHEYMAKHYRKMGLGRAHSRRAARSVIEELRKLGSMKMRDR